MSATIATEPRTNAPAAGAAATPHGVTIAWYAIATAALALTYVAMRDQWHRYSRNLRPPGIQYPAPRRLS